MRVCGAVRIGFFTAFIAAASLGEQVQGSLAQTRPSVSLREPANMSSRKESAPRKAVGTSEIRYTAGLVSGAPHSSEFAIAQEIATVLESGQETGPRGEMALRVMPMVGNGGSRNILDILTLAGADMAIAPVVLVDRLREAKTFGDIRGKLVYIVPLFSEEFHLLARPEIRDLTDLAGQTVNLGEEGSAGAMLGREVFNGLDVKISEVNLGLDAALDGMRNGQIVATLLVSGKPVNFLARYAQSDGIRFLPIPYSPALERDFLPSAFHHEDYPNIIATGESVDTIAIQSALFAYNWPIRKERFQLLELFVQTLFSRFPEFLGDGHHPKWREVTLAAQLPGWQRFRPAERWLERQSAGETALRKRVRPVP
ncbi:TAXI family TRAP transporter solute-binding subunit [Bradyrhizobium hereditatis]|uniref:TAXI family TRAP transporter solute-binding subunit n=1 Tax=Bradyrhizobium hereditatis TaxID=2821405 RepID=UPI001CE29924|nr:TAXI family TRAP transporter solute-binding subunit [Bradyrhizobium hereditatis]